MFDMAGSSLGALAALIFVTINIKFQDAFLYSIIPAIIGIMIIPFVREIKNQKLKDTKLTLKGLKLDKKTYLYLAVVFLFCLGNSSNVFLLLKAQDRGFSASEVMLLYLVFNVSTSILAIPSGRLSDKYGRRAILVPGYLIYGLVYIGFALLISKTAVFFLFVAYGAYTAFISGAERALVAEAAPEEFKGTVLGIYGMLQGIGLLISSIIAGVLWDGVNSDAPFWFGGVIGIIAALLIAVLLKSNVKEKSLKGSF